MKRVKWLTLLIMLSGGFAALFPCDVYMESSQIVAKGKNKFAVKLFVETVHRRCPLGVEKTGLTPEGLIIEKQGKWKKVEEGLYQMDLIVSLKGKSEGKLRVLRECPKRGLQEEILKFEPFGS